MNGSPGPPKKSQVTDSELIRAVQEQCTLYGVPVVKTKQVAEANYIDVTDQTVKRRLDDIEGVNSIQVGRGKVWWVPEGSVRGEIDMESVYLKELEPEDIPSELIRKHPEGRPTGLYALADSGLQSVRISLLIFLASLVLFLVQQIEWLPIPTDATEVIVAVGALGGFAVAFVSGLITIVALGIAQLDLPDLRQSKRLTKFRSWLAELISP